MVDEYYYCALTFAEFRCSPVRCRAYPFNLASSQNRDILSTNEHIGVPGVTVTRGDEMVRTHGVVVEKYVSHAIAGVVR